MAHEFKHPKYYTELRKRNKSDQVTSGDDGLKPQCVPGPGLKLTSSQAKAGKHPNPEPRVQASSQSQQAQGSDDQDTGE